MIPTPAAEGLRARGLRGRLAFNCDLDLHPACCTVLTGPSGSGKSLLLRMLADLDPCAGEVFLGTRSRGSVAGHAWRRWVGYVPAEAGWWDDNVAAHFAGCADAARALMPAVGLALHLLEVPVAQLSTGERQRMALLRAVVRQPRFLLLDEPTSALDADTVARVEAMLHRLKADGTGLLVVSHDAAQAARLADHRLYLTPGCLSEHAP